MTRFGAGFWLAVVLIAVFTTFRVKYAVQDVEDQLNKVRRETIAEQQEIRVLTAEWTYLNQPERLAELNQRFLSLVPLSARQLQTTIAELPLRAPAAPDVVLASAPPAAAPQPATAALPVIPAALAATPQTAAAPAAGPSAGAARVQLATAGSGDAPRSLDALFAEVAGAR